jgi:hypothetical protein
MYPLGQKPRIAGPSLTGEAQGAIIDGMTIGTFIIPTTKSKVIKTRDGTDVAARYLVYKLYEGTDGQPMQWATLQGLGESAATISRAVEHGWVVLQGSKPQERKAALTEEGRRLARRRR